MIYKSVVVAGAFTGILTASAFAADLPTRKAPPAPIIPVILPYNWTGCYVGGNVGGLWASKDFGSISSNDRSENGPNVGGQTANGTGFLVGGQVGCNYQVGQWVFGAQVDEDWADASGSGTQQFGTLYGSAAALGSQSSQSTSSYYYYVTNHFQVNSLGSATVRIGWAFDRFLPYIKGGVGWETVDYRETASHYSNYWSQSWGETLVGWTAGFGFEYAFTDHLTGFAEGDYYDFGSTNISGRYYSTSLNYSRSVKETDWVGKVGLNWKF